MASKRSADVQLTKDMDNGGDGTESGGTAPQRATAAQLAKRKIAPVRGANRPTNARRNQNPGTSPGLQMLSQSKFGNVDPNTVNGTSNQQNGSGDANTQPVFQFNPTPNGTDLFGSSATVPPSSRFSFTSNANPSISNPFTTNQQNGFGNVNSQPVFQFNPAATTTGSSMFTSSASGPPSSTFTFSSNSTNNLQDGSRNANPQSLFQFNPTATTSSSSMFASSASGPPSSTFTFSGNGTNNLQDRSGNANPQSAFQFNPPTTATGTSMFASSTSGPPSSGFSFSSNGTASMGNLFSNMQQNGSEHANSQPAFQFNPPATTTGSNIFGSLASGPSSSTLRFINSNTNNLQNESSNTSTQPVFQFNSAPNGPNIFASSASGPPSAGFKFSSNDTSTTGNPFPSSVNTLPAASNSDNANAFASSTSEPASSGFKFLTNGTSSTGNHHLSPPVDNSFSASDPVHANSSTLSAFQSNPPTRPGVFAPPTAQHNPSPTGSSVPKSPVIQQNLPPTRPRVSESSATQYNPPPSSSTISASAAPVQASSAFNFSAHSTSSTGKGPPSSVNPSLSASSSANAKGYQSTMLNSGGASNTEVSEAKPAETSPERDHLSTTMPPSIPDNLTHEQKLQYVTGYRVRSLNHGLKSHIVKNLDKFPARSLSLDVFKFYEETMRVILEARGLPANISSVKRKSIDEGRNEGQHKRANIRDPVATVGGADQPAFNDPTPNNKRKADEDISKETSVNGLSEPAKKARGNDVSYSSLLSTTTSTTANLFASVANGTTSRANAPNASPSHSSGPNVLQSPQTVSGSLFSLSTNQTSTAAAAKPSSADFSIEENSLSQKIQEAKKAEGFSFVPKAGTVATQPGSTTTNFLAQFGQSAKDAAKVEKEKRKAEDFDSEEEDEAEWERKYEEEQEAKRRKIKENKKAAGFSFVPKTDAVVVQSVSAGFQFKPSRPASGGLFATTTPGSSTGTFTSLTSAQTQPGNIFGHLSQQGSDAEESKAGNVEDDASGEDSVVTDDEAPEDSNTEEADQTQQAAPSEAAEMSDSSSRSTSRSFFDRVELDADGNPKRKAPLPINSLTGSSGSISRSNIFNGPSSSFTDPHGPSATNVTSNLFGQTNSPQLDNTWKPQSPIKFGATSAPSLTITAASPTKPASTNPSSLFTGHFGTTTAPGATVGFNFGVPNQSLGGLSTPSVFSSAGTSRATSPGDDRTDGESANDGAGAGDHAPPLEQIDLSNSRVGEEDENILFEVRAKLQELSKNESNESVWKVRGLGQLRVLQHRESGKTRMVLRSDTIGKIVLNTALMSSVDYKRAKEKTVMFMAATGDGKLASCTLTVGTKDDAIRLASVLEDNKSR